MEPDSGEATLRDKSEETRLVPTIATVVEEEEETMTTTTTPRTSEDKGKEKEVQEAEAEPRQPLKITVLDALQFLKPPSIAFKILIDDHTSTHTINRPFPDIIEVHNQLRSKLPDLAVALPDMADKKVARNPFTKKVQKETMEKYFQGLIPLFSPNDLVTALLHHKQPGDSTRIKQRSGKPPKALTDFDFLSVIGQGCMGKVFLVRKKDDQKIYALKILDKEWVLLQQELEHTKAEKEILMTIANGYHPFLVTLHYAFQTEDDLCLVLDYCRGGDLAGQLTLLPKFSEERARFYAAEIVLALEALHKATIVYRDLKPENCLLDEKGHVVLTDFGLSKKFSSHSKATTKTFCGTAEYLAPEIIRAEEYSYAVDWWSLGIFIYEMLSGMTPFYDENHQELYRRVLSSRLVFPAFFSEEAKSLISQLLDRNPKMRLGCRLKGVSEIKEHPFFRPIDWVKLYRKEIVPIWQPELQTELDVSLFDPMYTQQPALVEPRTREVPLPAFIQEKFVGFAYENPSPSNEPEEVISIANLKIQIEENIATSPAPSPRFLRKPLSTSSPNGSPSSSRLFADFDDIRTPTEESPRFSKFFERAPSSSLPVAVGVPSGSSDNLQPQISALREGSLTEEEDEDEDEEGDDVPTALPEGISPRKEFTEAAHHEPDRLVPYPLSRTSSLRDIASIIEEEEEEEEKEE